MNIKPLPLFYFSGTGNTWWVSQRLVEALNTYGFDARAYSIEQITPDKAAALIEKADIIGLGFPIYASDAPRIFHDFLTTLPHQAAAKSVLGYITQAGWSGDGINFLERPLMKRGYRLRWAIEINMPNNICLDLFPFPYYSDYAKFETQLEQARCRIENLAQKVAHNQGWRQNNSLLAAALAWTQRGPFRLAHDWGRKFWSVDEDICTSCGLCASQCPVGNIRMLDGLQVYDHNCVYCMRCFNYCPELAVRYMNSRNRRAHRTPPFKGPVPKFSPRLVMRKSH